MMYFPIGFVKVSGNSMLPTFKPGKLLIVSPIPYLFMRPQLGHIIVVSVNGKKMIKRISKIQSGGYEVFGDNLSESTDSRSFGLIKRKHILAKVI